VQAAAPNCQKIPIRKHRKGVGIIGHRLTTVPPSLFTTGGGLVRLCCVYVPRSAHFSRVGTMRNFLPHARNAGQKADRRGSISEQFSKPSNMTITGVKTGILA
jgi:hypothetical protein